MKTPYWIRHITGRLNCFRGVHEYRWSTVMHEYDTPKKGETLIVKLKITWCGYCGHVKDRKATHKITR